MRLKWLPLLVLCLILISCGENVGGVKYPPPDDNAPPDLGLGASFSTDVVGSYDITIIAFDSDLSPDFELETIVTDQMRNVETSSNGTKKVVQVKLTLGELTLTSNGLFGFSFKMLNNSNQLVTIGNFSNDYQDGTYAITGEDAIQFSFEEGGFGFGDATETTYTVHISETDGSMTLTADTPATDADYLTEIKCIK